METALRERSAEWVVRQAEGFYLSLGFDSLPATFWERSSLYPLPPDAPYKKNTHASAWHLDLDTDVRSLMSVEPNPYWYETAHHELGHVYYYMSYSQPEVPLVLRRGANRAYHEAIGSLLGLASLQRRFLAHGGLVPEDARADARAQLLQEALHYVVFIPFSAGTMTRFEHALYAEELAPDRLNAKWWELVRRYQGVVPPGPRGEEYADGLTKTHINDDPGQYYDYALSFALLFQLHDHIARSLLEQDPHDTDYYGSRAAGDFLRRLMAPGASRPWRLVLKETTGRELDARAMVEYFQPLYEWLREENRGRKHTLPERPGAEIREARGEANAQPGGAQAGAPRDHAVGRALNPAPLQATMKLCLVRHAEAKSEAEDPRRPLSDQGIETVRRVAEFLRASGAVTPAEVRHSTKLRAKQTAEMLVHGLGWKVRLREVPGLDPLDDVAPLADALAGERKDLVLVGHMPHLGRLASRLVGADSAQEAFDFPPGGVLCLRRKKPAGWAVEWMLAPALLGPR